MPDTHRSVSKTHRPEEAHDSVRDRAAHALDHSKETARRVAGEFEANPLGILVGGLAVGALAGALIPRSAREKELLAPLGCQLGDRARAAIQAARQAGADDLDARGLTRDAAKAQVRGIFDGVVKAASTAGSAAAKSAVHRS